MNRSVGMLDLKMMTSLCDNTLITILIAILSISCILALLLVIPSTVQHLLSLMSTKSMINKPDDATDDEINHLKFYERTLCQYRLMFNFSVFLIIMGASVPLVIHLINISHQSGRHTQADETSYEYVISLWGVCQTLTLLSIGSRLFFSWMAAIPPIIISIFFFTRSSRPNITFRGILILVIMIFVAAYLSPLHLILNLWEKQLDGNGTYYICVANERDIFYIRLRLFDFILCHLLPVLLILPSIAYSWIKLKVAAMDQFYESLIFVVANIPIIFVEVVEQISMSFKYDLSSGPRFANFFIILLTLYHISYTCMFLVAPIQSILYDGVDSSGDRLEVSNVYQVLVKRNTSRRSLERHFTALRR